jgi:hypothetical protein
MGKLKDAILILGEGPTECFYLNSLKDDFPVLQNIEPKMPKHTSLQELKKRIEKAVCKGYSKVFCMIDMDTKKDGSEKQSYEALKKKYNKPVEDAQNGIRCEVKFFETDRCTELFFLYYFRHTTKEYLTSKELEKDLSERCGYRKEQKFFARNPLHRFFTKNGGSLKTAIENADKSCKDVETRGYTYSQLGDMFKELGINPV